MLFSNMAEGVLDEKARSPHSAQPRCAAGWMPGSCNGRFELYDILIFCILKGKALGKRTNT